MSGLSQQQWLGAAHRYRALIVDAVLQGDVVQARALGTGYALCRDQLLTAAERSARNDALAECRVIARDRDLNRLRAALSGGQEVPC